MLADFLIVAIGLPLVALSIIAWGILMDRWIFRQFRWYI